MGLQRPSNRPALYRLLEKEDYQYAIHIPANDVLERGIARSRLDRSGVGNRENTIVHAAPGLSKVFLARLQILGNVLLYYILYECGAAIHAYQD